MAPMRKLLALWRQLSEALVPRLHRREVCRSRVLSTRLKSSGRLSRSSLHIVRSSPISEWRTSAVEAPSASARLPGAMQSLIRARVPVSSGCSVLSLYRPARLASISLARLGPCSPALVVTTCSLWARST